MPKGSSSRSGRPPDPNALRRERDAGDWITLPVTGRDGEIPPWPLPTKATKAEAKLWDEMWTMPQAVVWEQQRQFGEVALYVRKFIEAAKPEAPSTIVTAQRQMADSLGLTVPGLLRNRWRIGSRGGQSNLPRGPKAGGSSRQRFRVVDGSG